jgi:hypothetical protein
MGSYPAGSDGHGNPGTAIRDESCYVAKGISIGIRQQMESEIAVYRG